MNNRILNRFSLTLAALFSALTFSAGRTTRADTTDLLAATSERGSVHVNIYLHGSQERDDLEITAPLQAGISVIKNYDTAQYVVLDSRIKSYTILPLASAPFDIINGVPDISSFVQPATLSAHPQTRSETLNFTVTDEGLAAPPDMPGMAARHYSIGIIDTVDVAAKAGGAAAAGQAPARHEHTDFWVDPRYQRSFSPVSNTARRTVALPDGDKVVYTLTGDVAAYNQAMNYLPVEMFGSGLSQTPLKQTSAITTTSVDPGLLAIPSGYKQLSLNAFSNAEYDAILDLISGPQPKLPNAQPAQGTAASPHSSARGQ